jgi:hypothetical protein
VHNVSANGLFIASPDCTPDLKAGQVVHLTLPGVQEPVPLVVRQVHRRASGVGVQFDGAERSVRKAVKAHVTYQAEQERLVRMESHLHGGRAGNLKPMNEELAARVVLRPLLGVARALDLYPEGAQQPIVGTLERIDAARARLTITLDGPSDALAPYSAVFLGFRNGNTTCLADTVVESVDGPRLTVVLPERFFRPERRTYEREFVRGVRLLGRAGAHDVAADETRCGFSPHRPSPGGGALLVEWMPAGVEHLIVRTPGESIEVTGTVFAIEVTPEATEVSVVEGAVVVSRTDGSRSGERTLVERGGRWRSDAEEGAISGAVSTAAGLRVDLAAHRSWMASRGSKPATSAV